MGLLASMTSCDHKSVTKRNPHGDSVKVAVYLSVPIDYPEDLDPLYIPINMVGTWEEGDTVLADENELINIGNPKIRDAETKQDPRFHKVIIGQRDTDKYLPKEVLEDQ